MLLTLILFVLAGFVWSGIIFKHRRMTTFLATTGVVAQALWIFTTLLDRTLLSSASSTWVYIGAAGLFTALSIPYIRSWKLPYSQGKGSGLRDGWVLVALLLPLAAAYLISQYNGYVNNTWVSHGFFNGDTVTLTSLTQRSFSTDTLVHENPFAGNGYLEYPTLVHGSLASFLKLSGIGQNWLHFMPIITYAQIVLLVPMFFLLWDLVMPEPRNEHETWFGIRKRQFVYALQTGITVFVMSLGWDNFVYPQSHFFLTSIFVLLASLLVVAWNTKGSFQKVLLSIGAIVTIVLLFSNAVTGTAGVGLLGIWLVLAATTKSYPVPERLMYIGGAAALVILFLTASPGDSSFGMPQFSYTAAVDAMRLALMMGLLSLAVIREMARQKYLSVAVTVLSLLAFIPFFFSTRDIVIANASRFFFHALLVGFPLLLPLLVRVLFVIRRELLLSSRTLGEAFAGWGMVVVAVILILLPGAASVASAHDNLMFQDEQKIETPMRQALWWIEDQTEPNAIFISDPNPPFAIPMVTGRAVLRSDYWLSPKDSLLDDIQAAFAGDKASQEFVLQGVQDSSVPVYLILTKDSRSLWEPVNLEKVLDINSVVIYQAK